MAPLFEAEAEFDYRDSKTGNERDEILIAVARERCEKAAARVDETLDEGEARLKEVSAGIRAIRRALKKGYTITDV